MGLHGDYFLIQGGLFLDPGLLSVAFLRPPCHFRELVRKTNSEKDPVPYPRHT
jgi:hypothetical protein